MSRPMYFFVLRAHGYNPGDPKSLKSITATQAARLVIKLDMAQSVLSGLPGLFANWVGDSRKMARCEDMKARYSRRVDALNMLLKSYADLLRE